jgi:hypothetical protein
VDARPVLPQRPGAHQPLARVAEAAEADAVTEDEVDSFQDQELAPEQTSQRMTPATALPSGVEAVARNLP